MPLPTTVPTAIGLAQQIVIEGFHWNLIKISNVFVVAEVKLKILCHKHNSKLRKINFSQPKVGRYGQQKYSLQIGLPSHYFNEAVSH